MVGIGVGQTSNRCLSFVNGNLPEPNCGHELSEKMAALNMKGKVKAFFIEETRLYPHIRRIEAVQRISDVRHSYGTKAFFRLPTLTNKVDYAKCWIKDGCV